MDARPTILIVDDSPTQLMVLRDQLERAGFAVETSPNGLEAFAKVHAAPPDLILSDVLMPGLNGYHLCRLLKNDPSTVQIPMVLLTNLNEPQDRFWGQKAGADSYLDKDAPLPTIIDTVKALLTAHPPLAGKTGPVPSGFSAAAIQDRLTALLDRSLFESTISNETLQLTRLAPTPDLLARELFQFLSLICRFGAAALLVREGRNRFGLYLQVTEPVSESWRETSVREILDEAGLLHQSQCQVRKHLVNGAPSCSGREPRHLAPLRHHPLREGEEFFGSLTLFGAEAGAMTERAGKALKIVAERLLFVLRYAVKIQEIEEVKADVVSMLVHDMRSPLTSVRGFTDLLVTEMLGGLNADQVGALKTIQGGCDRLLQLIEDILDLSKLEAGKMEINPTPLQLRPLLQKVAAEFLVILAEKKLDLDLGSCGGDLLVQADEKQLTRVLNNLLANAVQFSLPGTTIRVVAQPLPPADQAPDSSRWLRISISDQGPGIPPEQQKMLFQRFQQLPSFGIGRKGTGLGLAICKEIITLHGGEIGVESPVGEGGGGSRFFFTIPAP